MSLITIKNDVLAVTLDSLGAVLHSILREGTEYLYQGDPRFWSRRDANLFPCVGRLYQGHYLLEGLKYPMTTHGFCQNAAFEVTKQTDTTVRFTLHESPDPKAVYPFVFSFHVEYTLEGDKIIKTCRVENRDNKTMCFGLGSHPAFQVPLGGEGEFSDWFFEFPTPSNPKQITFDHESWLLAEQRPAYPLRDGKRLPLRHDLFDFDAIVLQDAPRCVTLRSEGSDQRVTVEYPQMPFVGFWHTPHTEAPFVCVEPWLSLPSHSTYMEDLQTQENLIRLPAGEDYENVITITIQ